MNHTMCTLPINGKNQWMCALSSQSADYAFKLIRSVKNVSWKMYLLTSKQI